MNHFNTPPLRVCHVFCGDRGAAWMVEQLRELRDRYGCEVCAVISGSDGPLADRLKDEGIRFHATGFVYSLRQTPALRRAILSLAAFFRQQRFDVVQTHVFQTVLVTRPAAWIADVPVRLAMVSGPVHLEAQTSKWLERATAWMETALIPSCRRSLDLCLAMGIRPGRLPLIYYGADSSKFDPDGTQRAGIRAEQGWPEDTPVVALVAWFYQRPPPNPWWPPELHNRGGKGHEDFVRAAQQVLREFPGARFLLVGGPFDEGGQRYMDQVRRLVDSLGLRDKLIFTGHRNDVREILRDIDVAVQASLNENLGGTIEALLMQCPTVATRVGGMVDTVLDGQTGIQVNPSDPADLARGILELLRDPARARTLARAGRRLMLERMTLDRTVEDLHALYRRLTNDRDRNRKSYRAWVHSIRRAFLAPFCAATATLERGSAWAFDLRQKSQPLLRLDDLRVQNPLGDIADKASMESLSISDDPPTNGLFLGRGWHSLEQDDAGPFRWLAETGELLITRPDGQARHLMLDAESGPGQKGQAFELRIVDESGHVLDRATVSSRRDIRFRVQPPRAEFAVLRLKAPRGARIPTDVRVLNLRVRRVAWEPPWFMDPEMLRALNQPDDIVAAGRPLECQPGDAFPPNGIILGRGWHSLEQDDAGPFRWLAETGELLITRPDGQARHLMLDAESGPGQKGQAFELRIVDESGHVLDRATVSSRRDIRFRVQPPRAERAVLRLESPRGTRIPTDARVLNLRVRRVAWEPPWFMDLETLRALNQPDDIVAAEKLLECQPGDELPANGIFLGRGWHSREQDAKGAFRWLTDAGEIVITRPDGRRRGIMLDVQSGPGQRGRPFELRLVDAAGVCLTSAVVSARSRLGLALPELRGPGAILRLMAPEGRRTPIDDRILNLRVRRIDWNRAAGEE